MLARVLFRPPAPAQVPALLPTQGAPPAFFSSGRKWLLSQGPGRFLGTAPGRRADPSWRVSWNETRHGRSPRKAGGPQATSAVAALPSADVSVEVRCTCQGS